MPQRLFLAAFVLLAVSNVTGQPAARRATTLTALATYPEFFNGQQVVVRGDLAEHGKTLTLGSSDSPATFYVISKEGSAPTGPVEVRGEFFDASRLAPDDPRLAGETLGGLIETTGERHLKAGELLILIARTVTKAEPPGAPAVRTIALEPSRFIDQRVTVSGQFRGRNLYGEVPQAPGMSKYDFVLHSADAAIWVTGIRPRGKGFDLDVGARVDTNRWLEVTGVVKSSKGLVWVEGTQLALATPFVETDDAPTAAPSVGPSPEVIFSAPTQDEADVALDTSVRMQFSRDLKPESIRDQVRVSYLLPESTERGEPTAPPIKFTANYVTLNRVLEIKFAQPLERFRTLKLELLEGITATDGATLKPWTLTFVLGGS
jgi:hypothetical protein